MPFRWALECNALIYKRGCQENTSPSTGRRGDFRDIQPPLSCGRRWSGVVPWIGFALFHLSSCIFVSSDDANQF
jgi:hypothetical protein